MFSIYYLTLATWGMLQTGTKAMTSYQTCIRLTFGLSRLKFEFRKVESIQVMTQADFQMLTLISSRLKLLFNIMNDSTQTHVKTDQFVV